MRSFGGSGFKFMPEEYWGKEFSIDKSFNVFYGGTLRWEEKMGEDDELQPGRRSEVRNSRRVRYFGRFWPTFPV